MRGGRTVIIVGRGPELEQALDAMAELDLPVRVIPTVLEAERALLGTAQPRVSAVLVCLAEDPERGLRFIRSLRSGSALAAVTIAAWAPAGAAIRLADAYRAGASSGVLLDGSHEDPIRLARMIHYWAVANEPPMQEALA